MFWIFINASMCQFILVVFEEFVFLWTLVSCLNSLFFIMTLVLRILYYYPLPWIFITWHSCKIDWMHKTFLTFWNRTHMNSHGTLVERLLNRANMLLAAGNISLLPWDMYIYNCTCKWGFCDPRSFCITTNIKIKIFVYEQLCVSKIWYLERIHRFISLFVECKEVLITSVIRVNQIKLHTFCKTFDLNESRKQRTDNWNDEINYYCRVAAFGYF